MENEKKKRKNKKKKNKQIKTSEDEAIVSESTSLDDNHMRNGQNGQNPNSDTVDLSYQHTGGTKDAILEETIEHLKKESLLLAHNKAKLEDTIEHLHEENNVHIQKRAELELKLSKFEGEKLLWLQKEADLELKLSKFEGEKLSWLQKEADLELKLSKFEGEKLSWLQKEEELVDTIISLQEDKTALGLEGAGLLHTIEQLERDKVSLVLNENSRREMMVDRNKDMSRLKAQVMELEEQRRDLLQENKQLTENVADSRSKIMNLEMKISSTHTHSSDRVTKEMLNSQVDAARILVDKLITENSELMGKVNELYIELQRVTNTERSSATEPDQMVEATDTSTFNDPEPPSIQDTITSSESLDTLESVPIHNHSIVSNNVDLDNDDLPTEVGEIEQIPLHENEDSGSDDEKDVLLSDAPLIGAPFRLISFMAKYVSGADLVAKS